MVVFFLSRSPRRCALSHQNNSLLPSLTCPCDNRNLRVSDLKDIGVKVLSDTKADCTLPICGNISNDEVSILLGNGTGSFGPRTPFSVGPGPLAVAVGRFNSDNFDDLAVANNASDTMSILLGNGVGGFGAQAPFFVGPGPVSVVVGRFDSDAFNDLAVTNALDDTVSVVLGDGAGGFGARTLFPVGFLPLAVNVGRFNADAIGDLVTANASSDDVTVLLFNP